MKLRTLTLAAAALLTLSACGDAAEDTAPSADTTTAIPNYDPDTTMAPPPGTDTTAVDSASDTTAVPATDTANAP